MTDENKQNGYGANQNAPDIQGYPSSGNAPDDNLNGGINNEPSFIQQAKHFCQSYKSEIGLVILVLYVITLAVATFIEILEH